MIVAAVLAAGGSSRLGHAKQLVEYGGKPLIVHALEVASFLPCAVVLGAQADAVGAAVPPSVVRLHNDAWTTGMASSIHAATNWALAEDAEALLLHLVDQPLVDRAHLERLVAEYRAGVQLVGSRYLDIVGAPAIFARAVFPELLALEGDRGAAPILRSHPEARAIPGPAGAIDVDTPADVKRLTAG